MSRKMSCAAIAAGFGLLMVARPSLADSEPYNNNYPWSTDVFENTVSMWELRPPYNSGTNNWTESINPRGDKDYFVMTCGGREVQSVYIGILDNIGDLDIKVYDLNGNFLGVSQGVTGYESVDVSSRHLQAVVLYVYGYNSQYTGSFSHQATCPS
jgi:hypothetical protein